jgi:hypothetical protein
VVYGCNDLARAAADGRWRAEVRVGPRAAAIEAANSADPGDADRVRVRVRRPRHRPPPAASPAPTAAPPPVAQAPVPAARRPRRLVMIGDSLAVGTEAILPGLLPGWRVVTHGLTSRPLSAGMQLLSTLALGNAPVVLAFSLFTNDDPRNVGALDAAVRTSVARAGPSGCAVWATIVRPPVNGVGYGAANGRLRRLARDPALGRNLRIVPWAAEVARHPDWLAPDGVHGTATGYAGRAQLYARAARSC